MLQQLHVENYKCLRDVTVDLGDFTVFIGPNDSGKSSILEVVGLLGKIATGPLDNAFPGSYSLENVVWRKERSRPLLINVSGRFADNTFEYGVELFSNAPFSESLIFNGSQLLEIEKGNIKVSPHGFHPGVAPHGFHPSTHPHLCLPILARNIQTPFFEIAEALSSSVRYRFDPEKLSGPSIPEPMPSLHSSGENLASLLDALRNHPDRGLFDSLEKALQEAIPSLQGIRLPPAPVAPGAKTVEYLLSGNGQLVTIPAQLASNGALLLTAYLALAYSDTPGVLLFEEPENGLHPALLGMVVDLLRKMSTGEVGNRKRQVLVTTHSPLLLNYAKPDEVRVLFRDPEQGTRVTPMAQVSDIDKLLKEFGVGELWYLLGEEKLVAGTPS